jgi:hypothetical protein
MNNQLYNHYRATVHDALWVAQHWDVSLAIGFALKYLQRAGKKTTESYVKDLSKATWYLTYESGRHTLPHVEARKLADDVTTLIQSRLSDYSGPSDSASMQDSLDSQLDMKTAFDVTHCSPEEYDQTA